MIKAYRNWRKRNGCFHHDRPAWAPGYSTNYSETDSTSWVKEELADLGRRKRYECLHCGKVWVW